MPENMAAFWTELSRTLTLRISATTAVSLIGMIFSANAGQEFIDAHYKNCINNAFSVYKASYAIECKRLAYQTEQGRANCLVKLKLSPAYCDVSYPARDASTDCTLPAVNSTVINAALERARYRCARESGTSQ